MNFLKKLFSYRNQRVDENTIVFGPHIHKTAGITFLQQIKGQLDQNQYYFNSMYAVNYKEGVQELEERSYEELQKIRIVYGHGVSEYMLSFFKERNVILFTFLREPISRIISWYCYDRKLLSRFGHQIPDFQNFYKRYFPRLSLCNFLIGRFPTFIDSKEDPLHLQAFSILKKFHFISTLEDFSDKAPVLFDHLGLTFSKKAKMNITNYEKELDFENQLDFDFLKEDNSEDIKLYQKIQKHHISDSLNYIGFDEEGFQKSIQKIFSRKINPNTTLLRNYKGPIKHNYKLEKIHDMVVEEYEKQLATQINAEKKAQGYDTLLIKAFALEERKEQKEFYRSLLHDLNQKKHLGIENLLKQ
jgi:hypothetical protein